MNEHSGIRSLSNMWAKFELDLGSGRFSLQRADGAPVFTGAWSGCEVGGRPFRTTDGYQRTWRREQVRDMFDNEATVGILTCEGLRGAPELEVRFNLPAQDPFLTVGLTVTNPTGQPMRLDSFVPLEVQAPEGAVLPGIQPVHGRVFVNSHGKTRAVTACLAPEGQAHEHRGYWDGCVNDVESKRALVFGALSARSFGTQVLVNHDPAQTGSPVAHLRVMQDAAEWRLLPGESRAAEPVYLNGSEPVLAAYERYGELVGRAMEAIYLEHPPSGWCSWHVPFTEINEEFVLRNAAFVASRPDIFSHWPGGFNYIQIDYGWQKENTTGANEVDPVKFPRGMGYVAQQIHDLGLWAGIWIAPFHISRATHAFARCPQMVVQSSAGGEFLVGDWAGVAGAGILDATNPAGRQHLRDRVREIILGWGYDMIKFDGTGVAQQYRPDDRRLARTGLPVPPEARAVYHDSRVTPVEHFRLGLRTIVQAAEETGEDVLLSPCGAPFLQTVGICRLNYDCNDAYQDTRQGVWDDERSSVKNLGETWAHRYYMHQRYWTNNSESMLLGDPRPLEHAIVTCTAGALSGGVIYNGDDLPALSEEKLRVLARVLPLYGVAAKPVGLFEQVAAPGIWDLKVRTDWESWDVVGLFNWGDEDQAMRLDFTELGLDPQGSYLAFDFWQTQPLGEHRESLTLPVPRRSCRLVSLRRSRGRPQVLGTEVHFTMGALELSHVSWRPDRGELRLTYRCPRQDQGTVYLHAPDGSHFSAVEGEEAEAAALGGAVTALTLPYRPDPVTYMCQFSWP